MAGFRNDVVYGINVDFSGKAIPAATITTDNQILVGTTATNADGSHVQVGVLTAGTNVTIDNTVLADGKLTINASGSGGANTCMFYASTGGDSGGITGDGTAVDITFSDIVQQNGSGYDSGTGVFTAPVDGVYQFSTFLTLYGMDSSHVYAKVYFQLSTGSISDEYYFNPWNASGSSDNASGGKSLIVKMTAGDTIKVSLQVGNGTKVVGVQGAFFTTLRSTFIGCLLNPDSGGSGSSGLTQLFFANNSTDLSGVTGDGTSYDVIFDNLTYGQTGSGYDTTTGIFTAPSTGWYFFTYRLGLSGITGSHTACNCDLVTTDTYGLVYRTLANPAAIKDSGNDCTVHDSQIVYLQAASTIKVQITVYSGTKDISIIGPQSTVQFYSTFTGAKFA